MDGWMDIDRWIDNHIENRTEKKWQTKKVP